MNDLKTAANTTRSKLDDKNIGAWKNLTQFTSQCGDVVRTLRNEVRPELCTGAWAKMYQMLHQYKLAAAVGTNVATAHVCEAPGAFIAATNHYLRQLHGAALDW